MQRSGIIEPTNSDRATALGPIKKKTGGIRLCIDYRKLNQVTKKDSYSIPRLDETTDKFYEIEVFTTLNMASGYYQVKMDTKNKEKTAIDTPFRLPSTVDPQPRVARWIVRLSEYSFRIEYRPGKLNGNADSLSRWSIENDEKDHEKNLDSDFYVIMFTDCQTDQQTEDKNIAQVIEWKNLSNSRPDVKGLTSELRTLWLQWNRLRVINGVLYPFAYRTAVHRATGYTPFQMVYGRQPKLPIDLFYESCSDPLELDWAEGADFSLKDKGWLINSERKKGKNPKLAKLWKGPFEIIEILGPVNYKIKALNGKKRIVVHRNRLKRCFINLNLTLNDKTCSPSQEADVT
ncbi:unnamed protein product [Brachionus calyciflorus]|uniref:Uncharacterized protein n=1 Tax=Brachionus calyciflorus TaxID=104777 RepID=A0A814HXB3_9BILA|nr:unnamed protein product [Brachionus calyciflorus]